MTLDDTSSSGVEGENRFPLQPYPRSRTRLLTLHQGSRVLGAAIRPSSMELGGTGRCLKVGVCPGIHYVQVLMPNAMVGSGPWAFGSCLGPEGRALVSGAGARIKDTPQSAPVPSTR